MKVLKFGGTSVGDGRRIANVARLVGPRAGEVGVVVVSAIGGVTDALLDLAARALRGRLDEASDRAELLLGRHRTALAEAGLGDDLEPLRREIEARFKEISDLATGIALLKELPPRTQDAIVASGELLSSRILTAVFQAQGAPAVWVDPRDLVPTDAGYGAAVPDEAGIAAATARLVRPHLEARRMVVTGGFVGRGPSGETTTLGRGGSDYSAALLAAALDADAIEIWTDVDGILTADPRVVQTARPVPAISYAEASELAFFGAKVLHPATVRPAVRKGIPVWIKNTLRPEAPGSVVRRDAEGSGVRALAARKGIAAVFISNPQMLLAHGYAARVFDVFEKHRVPVDVITTSEVSISTTVDKGAPFDALLADLRTFADVEVRHGLAVLTVVGRRLRSTPAIAARVFQALGEVNVVMISQGASDTNLTFVVDEKDVESALRQVHAEFCEGGAPQASGVKEATA
jgi:aspartate kinase